MCFIVPVNDESEGKDLTVELTCYKRTANRPTPVMHCEVI